MSGSAVVGLKKDAYHTGRMRREPCRQISPLGLRRDKNRMAQILAADIRDKAGSLAKLLCGIRAPKSAVRAIVFSPQE